MVFTSDKVLRKTEAWTQVKMESPYNLKPAKVWCQSNYPCNRWYYWYGSNSFWFDDPKIATEFVLRFA